MMIWKGEKTGQIEETKTGEEEGMVRKSKALLRRAAGERMGKGLKWHAHVVGYSNEY
jgi:hypothetical protein